MRRDSERRRLDAGRELFGRIQNTDVRIEFPSRGATYCRQEYGVYAYSEYGRSSVLAGQQCRSFLDSFSTLEEAQARYPAATVANECGYRAPFLEHLSDEEPDI